MGDMGDVETWNLLYCYLGLGLIDFKGVGFRFGYSNGEALNPKPTLNPVNGKDIGT